MSSASSSSSSGRQSYSHFRYRTPLGFSLSMPSELWGAASIALKLSKIKGSLLSDKVQASASSAAPSMTDVTLGDPKSIAQALEYTPELSNFESCGSLLAATLICFAVYTLTAPKAISIFYSLGMGVFFAGVVVLLRHWIVERHYASVQVEGRDLACPFNSHFIQVGGIDLHYRVSKPRKTIDEITTAIHCLHGFGASSWSWSFVQDRLANALNAPITAHDMPGFGLSMRPSNNKYYTLVFNGSAAKTILEEHVEFGGSEGKTSKKKMVIIGHSMGAAAAAEGIIADPTGVTAVVLVAPAIVALWPAPPMQAAEDPVATSLAVVEEMVSAQDSPRDLPYPPAQHQHQHQQKTAGVVSGWKLVRVAGAMVQGASLLALRILLQLSQPFFVLILRKLVRSEKFWERGLATAWWDKSRVTREYVDSYRFPQLIRGWEAGILHFLWARFSEKNNFIEAIQHATQGDGHLTQAERLANVVRLHNIRVLIVHGKDDALVPIANSCRLAQILPNTTCIEFNQCGHMPHEEMPEKFVEEVSNFVQRLSEVS